MQRSKLFELKLYGMKAAFDEIMASAIKRQHEPQRIIGDLARSARSRRALSTNARVPLPANRWAAIRARHS
jgi:hypothetical protein